MISIISDLIAHSSNIGANLGGDVMIDGLEDIMMNMTETDADLTLLFKDGATLKISVE